MTGLDQLVTERFVPFRERILAAYRDKHPGIFAMIDAVLAGKENRVGLQVLEGGRVAGEYTLHLKGVSIAGTDCGKLDSGFNHPFLGVFRPYLVIEQDTLERMIGDEPDFIDDLPAAIVKYLPECTLKFLR